MLIILLGPTAVGKTRAAIELAKAIDGEIISADSMQVYRGMDIGTAKPTMAERQGIPHHLIDIVDPDQSWTVSDFVEQTNQLLPQIKNPIIVGGTGFYLWTLLHGYAFPPQAPDDSIRKKLRNLETKELYTELQKIDPTAAEKINPNDKKRIVRALEVFELTGRPISELQKDRRTARPQDRQTHLIGLNLPREELYQRIEKRIDQMIEKGLIDEVRGLLAKGYSKNLQSMQALGYKEAIDYLEGKYAKEEMIAELKKRTRNFAKRQITWFKRFENVLWIETDLPTEALLAKVGDVV